MPSRHKSSACTDYVPAICTHRPSLLLIGCRVEIGGFREAGATHFLGETYQYSAARRSKSRNKVAVGEPAAGSLPKSIGYAPSIFHGVNALLSLLLAAAGQVTLTALIGGCLGSGIDEDRG